MRWGTAYTVALGTGFLTAHSDAFVAPATGSATGSGSTGTACTGAGTGTATLRTIPTTTTTTTLSVGDMGWDNDNFLDALGKGSDALNEANEEYNRTSKFQGPPGPNDEISPTPGTRDPSGVPVDGAEISNDQVERIKQNNEKEEHGGGEMFKKLMERAQQKEPNVPMPKTPQSPQTPLSPAGSAGNDPAAPSAHAANNALPAGFEDLPVEKQAALFRELMANPPANSPQSFPGPKPGPRPPATGQAPVAADGRRIGRNRDADAIVNTSDVYFQQLKTDSSLRNQARRAGDEQKANAVFADPSIKEIKLHVNPHIEEQRKKEQQMLDTAADEMFPPVEYVRQEPRDISERGISYKETLMERKKGNKSSTVPDKPATAASESASPPTQEVTPPKPVAATSPQAQKVTPPKPVAATSPPAQKVTPPKPVAAPISPAAVKQQASKPVSKTPEETRRDLRTLMGLLLKHRGGPGFGSGRLQGKELERFMSLSEDLLETIRSETPAPPNAPSKELKTESPPQRTVSEVPSSSEPSAAIAEKSEIPKGDRIATMMSCIEGAVLMYKNSPPELQPSVLVTLRAALLSAVDTCNDIMGVDDNATVPSTNSQQDAIPQAERVNSMIACIEGSLLMYKNSPPGLQEGVMVTLRAALMSAINICDVCMVDEQLHSGSAAPPAAEVKGTPQRSTNAVPEKQVSKTTVHSGSDANSQYFESVYEKLKAAAGQGKMGLSDDLDPADAEDLANEISKMRALLVEELDTGIPESEAKLQSASDQPSKYQELLAKAKLAKKGEDQ